MTSLHSGAIIGGHFISPLCWQRSLLSVVQEHVLGPLITNAAHPDFLLWALKYLNNLYEKVCKGPKSLSMAWFLNMCKSFMGYNLSITAY